MNSQIESLLEKVNATQRKEYFQRVDAAISILYINKFITGKTREGARLKLTRQILTQITVERE